MSLVIFKYNNKIQMILTYLLYSAYCLVPRKTREPAQS